MNLIKDKEVNEMEFYTAWDFRVAIDLFLGGAGIGIFLLTAYFILIKKEKVLSLARIGFLLSPILVGLGVISLMTELGRPLKIFSTFVNVNPTSVTSWGGFLQFIFILLSFVLFLLIFKQKHQVLEKSLFKGLVITGFVFALAVGVYHGVLLMSLGRAGWASGLIPVMFLVSSLLAGSCIVMAIDKSLMKSQSAQVTVAESAEYFYSKLFVSLTAIQILLLITWRISIFSSGAEEISAYQNLIDHFGGYWWILVVAIGLIFPLAIGAYYVIKKQKMNMSLALIFAVLVLIGSYAFKHIIIYSGQIPLI